MIQDTASVGGELGLHLRAAARLVAITSRAQGAVRVVANGSSVDGKSLLGITSLLAGPGTQVRVEADLDADAEIVKEAVQDANENAILNNLSNRCEFYVRDLTKPGPLEGFDVNDDEGEEEEENADCLVEAVIVDPARPGCSKDILSEIRKLRPKRIVYVSCNPDTQARDANILFGNEDEADDKDETKKRAKYALLSVTPCDMFPHALHVETVAVFDRV